MLWIMHADACCGLRERGSLWISQPFVLGRIFPRAVLAVDYGLRPVDYGPVGPVDYASLWISGLGRCGGWLRPHAPQAGLSPARYASCGCFSGAHGGGALRPVD